MSVSRSEVSWFTFVPLGESLFQLRRDATTPAGTPEWICATRRMRPRSLKTSTASPSRMPRCAASSGWISRRPVWRLHLLMRSEVGEGGVHAVVGLAREELEGVGAIGGVASRSPA